MPIRTGSQRQHLKSISFGVFLAGTLMLAVAPGGAQSPRPATPYTAKHLYSETADPAADIKAGLAQAKREHKRVILDFGGDWCGDCQVLYIYFHDKTNAPLIARHFIIVPIFIGQMDRNLDVAKKYSVPVEKGVPALAVLDAHGKLLYSQQTGQFGHMRDMSSKSVTEFLNRWKA